jgi:plasmid stability protein
MTSITVRKIDDDLKRKLRVRAARNGRSMEDEIRTILRSALHRQQVEERDLGSAIRRRFAPFGGVKLEVASRATRRSPPRFDK